MAHPWRHAESSARKFGGKPEDYIALHEFLDSSKAFSADIRHRALLHHSAGIFVLEQVFGRSITNSDGKVVFVRYIGEQHVREDLGRIPTLNDWIQEIHPRGWMAGQSLPEPPSNAIIPIQKGPQRNHDRVKRVKRRAVLSKPKHQRAGRGTRREGQAK